MSAITDDDMKQMLQRSRLYCVVLLHPGPRYEDAAMRSPEVAKLIWEHGRRNFELRAAGKLALVGPGTTLTPFVGLGVFAVSPEETQALMDADPSVQAGIFTYEIAEWRSFPGDSLPAVD